MLYVPCCYGWATFAFSPVGCSGLFACCGQSLVPVLLRTYLGLSSCCSWVRVVVFLLICQDYGAPSLCFPLREFCSWVRPVATAGTIVKLIFVFILISPQGKYQFGSVLVTVGAACTMRSGQIFFGGTPAEWEGFGGMSPQKNERAECEVLTSYLESIWDIFHRCPVI